MVTALFDEAWTLEDRVDKEDSTSITPEQNTELRVRRPWTPPRLVHSADVLDDVQLQKGIILETGIPMQQASSEPSS